MGKEFVVQVTIATDEEGNIAHSVAVEPDHIPSEILVQAATILQRVVFLRDIQHAAEMGLLAAVTRANQTPSQQQIVVPGPANISDIRRVR